MRNITRIVIAQSAIFFLSSFVDHVVAENRNCSTTTINVSGVLDSNDPITNTDAVLLDESSMLQVDWELADYFASNSILNLKFRRIGISQWQVNIVGSITSKGGTIVSKDIATLRIDFDAAALQNGKEALGFGAASLDPSLSGNRIVVDIQNFKILPGKQSAYLEVQSEQSSSCGGFGEIVSAAEVNGNTDKNSTPIFYSLDAGQRAMLNDVPVQ